MPPGRTAAALLGCSVLSGTSDAVRANARCESLVPKTLDVVPSRSPQAVHTLQLPFLIDKDIIEIGTRGGDGMQCFARVAKTATAIELRPHYCELLRLRAQALPRPFSVECQDYRKTERPLDADVFLFWMGSTREDIETICSLAGMRNIRAGAHIMTLIDHQDKADVMKLRRFAGLNASVGAQWAHFEVDEIQQCLQAWNTSEMFKYKARTFMWTGCRVPMPGCVASQAQADRMNAELNTPAAAKAFAAKRCVRAKGSWSIVYVPLLQAAEKLKCIAG